MGLLNCRHLVSSRFPYSSKIDHNSRGGGSESAKMPQRHWYVLASSWKAGTPVCG